MTAARRRSNAAQWRRLRPKARELRKDSTSAEEVLWQALRNRGVMGAKFRRQHAFGPFIVDFVCLERGLVIEVDGASHDGQQARDRVREAYLAAAGLDVLRVTNGAVRRSLDDVIEQIQRRLEVGTDTRGADG